LGKAFEDKKDYDKAFEYYLKGNEEHRANITYDPVQTELAHEKMRETYSQQFIKRIEETKPGNADPSPIFIVGLPRSGSTLLEQILASHSMVDGTSELPDLGVVSQMIPNKAKGRTFPAGILSMSDDEIRSLGDEYLDRTSRHRKGARHFTDKMPNNFAHIGLLHAILPNAKIIDSDRLVNWARLVKSDAEIGLMKSAAQISERGMKTAMEVINPGVRQCDAVGEIQKTLFYGTEEFGGEYSSIATLLPTGKGTSASHLTASQDKFVEGEATIIELSGVYKRYHAPMARTLLLGKPDQLKIDTMNKTIEA
jgi:hypothetical protein